MAITVLTTKMAAAVNYTVVTDSSADWPLVANSTYFYDKVDKLPHYKDASGNIIEVFTPATSTSNIYNTDGSLTANRILTGAGYELLLTGLKLFTVDITPGSGISGYTFNVDTTGMSGSVGTRVFKVFDITAGVERLGVDINGYTRINSAYLLPNNVGTSGQALLTSGTGPTAWGDLYNQIVEDEGVALTQRTNLNFTGAGVSVADVGGKTTVTIDNAGTQSFYNQFVTNQYCYFLASDSSALFDVLRAGGTLTSVGTTSALVENPMGVLFTTPTAVGSVTALYGNTFGGNMLGTNFQFEMYRKFRINTTNGAQRFFAGLSSLYTTTAPTNIEPTSQINSIGVCKLQATGNLFLMWNDATGIATSVDTGFTATSTAFTYLLRIYKTYGVAAINIELTQINNSTGVTAIFSQTNITTDYNTGAAYYPVAWMGNNTAVTGAVSYKEYGCTLTKRNIIAA